VANRPGASRRGGQTYDAAATGDRGWEETAEVQAESILIKIVMTNKKSECRGA